MTNYAEQRYNDTMTKINELKFLNDSSIPNAFWNEMYLIIKGTKGWFEEWSWDEIMHILSKPTLQEDCLTEQELDEILTKIIMARKDETFRKFYELMKTIDELEPLMKKGE